VKKSSKKGLDFEIDKLTNSIENVVTGDRFITEVAVVTPADLNLLQGRISGNLTGILSTRIQSGKYIS
jgi:hypothetical protein